MGGGGMVPAQGFFEVSPPEAPTAFVLRGRVAQRLPPYTSEPPQLLPEPAEQL